VPIRVTPTGEAVPNAIDDFFRVVAGSFRADCKQERFKGVFKGLSQMPLGHEPFHFSMQRQRIAAGPGDLSRRRDGR
jgi:hypothetical protein